MLFNAHRDISMCDTEERRYNVPRITQSNDSRPGSNRRHGNTCRGTRRSWQCDRGLEKKKRISSSSIENERASERGNTERRGTVQLVVGYQPRLIWRLYVYYDAQGRNTNSSLLANWSEKSAKPSPSLTAPLNVFRIDRSIKETLANTQPTNCTVYVYRKPGARNHRRAGAVHSVFPKA
ncbi:uncharacterized protein LOC143264292 [Megachile rotundata]|uniref:uncharacterized protein LOC143264292 n=1 Tax=Megachile rotundata TaxID=143995 RepID=UPI003FD19C0F